MIRALARHPEAESSVLIACSLKCLLLKLNRLFPSYLVAVPKRVLMQNLPDENEFDLHENEQVDV